jgi:hypothetical protein
MTARKEKCIIVRGDESAWVISNSNSEEWKDSVGRRLALYLECSNGELRCSAEWLSMLNGMDLGRTLVTGYLMISDDLAGMNGEGCMPASR